MTGKDLMIGLSDISPKYYKELETASIEPTAKHRTLRRPLLIAALVALFMMLVGCAAMYVEYANGFISNLLSPLYGGAQTEIVDGIGVPVGASTTVGDYTLTADAVIGDRYNLAVVYTLSRVDGEPLQEGLRFKSSFFSFSSSGGSSSYYTESEDHKELHIVDTMTFTQSLRFHRNYTTIFTDLELQLQDMQEKQLVQAGQWELKFPLRYKDSSERISTGTVRANNENGLKYEIHGITISPIGIHMDVSILGDSPQESCFNAHANIVLQDDSEIQLSDWNFGGVKRGGSKSMDADFGAMYPAPIPLDSIKAVVFEDVSIPITLP